MAKVITLCLLFILSNFLSVNFVVGNGNSLTIKLIHRDSPESPFYEPNLNFSERIERLIDQSKTRLKYYSTLNLKKPSDLGGKVDIEKAHFFLAQLGIGSFLNFREPFKLYYFLIDVGSHLTWLDCKDCKRPGNHCLRPNEEPFPADTSKTYDKLECKPTRGPRHALCDPRECIGEFCGYKVEYEDNSTSKGFLAQETFTFDTTIGPNRKERVPKLVFGCGFDTRNMNYGNGSKIAGILGLGWGALSIVNQLGSKSNGIFSYCLQRMSQSNVSTFIQFGDSIPKSRAIYSTPMRKVPGEVAYYVDLIGITAAGTNLNLNENDFSRKPNRTGGCIIDSGTAYTHLVHVAYAKLTERLMAYFANIRGLMRVKMGKNGLCYKRMGAKEGFRNLPTITLHFRGAANLQLEPESIYILSELDGKEVFCLAMISNNEANRLTMIGAYQQTNHRFNFMTRKWLLQFGPENCARNA